MASAASAVAAAPIGLNVSNSPLTNFNLFLNPGLERICNEVLGANVVSQIEGASNIYVFSKYIPRGGEKAELLSLNKIFETLFARAISTDTFTSLIGKMSTNVKLRDKTLEEKTRIIKIMIKRFVNPPIAFDNKGQVIFDKSKTEKYFDLLIKSLLKFMDEQFESILIQSNLDLSCTLINEIIYKYLTDEPYDWEHDIVGWIKSQILESIVVLQKPSFVKIHLLASGDIFDTDTNKFYDVKSSIAGCKTNKGTIRRKDAHSIKHEGEPKTVWTKKERIDGFLYMDKIERIDQRFFPGRLILPFDIADINKTFNDIKIREEEKRLTTANELTRLKKEPQKNARAIRDLKNELEEYSMELYYKLKKEKTYRDTKSRDGIFALIFSQHQRYSSDIFQKTKDRLEISNEEKEILLDLTKGLLVFARSIDEKKTINNYLRQLNDFFRGPYKIIVVGFTIDNEHESQNFVNIDEITLENVCDRLRPLYNSIWQTALSVIPSEYDEDNHKEGIFMRAEIDINKNGLLRTWETSLRGKNAINRGATQYDPTVDTNFPTDYLPPQSSSDIATTGEYEMKYLKYKAKYMKLKQISGYNMFGRSFGPQ